MSTGGVRFIRVRSNRRFEVCADFRAKYGPPLARQIFTGRPGIKMIVDYAANGHICRNQLPVIDGGYEANELLTEMMPLTLRGKEIGHSLHAFGGQSLSMIEYENVSISESLQGTVKTGITVFFKKEMGTQNTKGSCAQRKGG